jgi:hypothetical protein
MKNSAYLIWVLLQKRFLGPWKPVRARVFQVARSCAPSHPECINGNLLLPTRQCRRRGRALTLTHTHTQKKKKWRMHDKSVTHSSFRLLSCPKHTSPLQKHIITKKRRTELRCHWFQHIQSMKNSSMVVLVIKK